MKDEKQAKKQWERPELKTIRIQNTLGGINPGYTEITSADSGHPAAS